MKRAPRRSPLPFRFWRRVQEGDPEECWLWTGAVMSTGYGAIRVDGTTVLAHRLAFELQIGPVPPELVVRHLCHTKLCCNGDHLAIGTDKDNSADSCADGLQPREFERPQTKLSDAEVREIRATYTRGGILQRELADRYGVTQQSISRIVLRSGRGGRQLADDMTR